MRITIEIDSKSELEKLSSLFRNFNIKSVDVISPEGIQTAITKGDKKINPTSLFGMWAKKPKSLDEVRKTAWQRGI